MWAADRWLNALWQHRDTWLHHWLLYTSSRRWLEFKYIAGHVLPGFESFLLGHELSSSFLIFGQHPCLRQWKNANWGYASQQTRALERNMRLLLVCAVGTFLADWPEWPKAINKLFFRQSTLCLVINFISWTPLQNILLKFTYSIYLPGYAAMYFDHRCHTLPSKLISASIFKCLKTQHLDDYCCVGWRCLHWF